MTTKDSSSKPDTKTTKSDAAEPDVIVEKTTVKGQTAHEVDDATRQSLENAAAAAQGDS